MILKKIFKQKSNFATRNINGELVLVPLKNNIADMTEMFVLNELGDFIWNNIDGINDENKIIKLITENFDIDENTARTDFNEFIKKIEKVILKP
jgi:hypothetical protein